MDPFWVQLITVMSLLVGNTLFGTLPLFISKICSSSCAGDQDEMQKRRVSAFLLFFGGGIFISDCFLVLLPQTRTNLETPHDQTPMHDDGDSGHHHSFPIPELIIVCCFFAAYLVKEIICSILCKLNSTARKSSDHRVQFCSCAKRHTECSRTYKEKPDETLFGLDNKLMESGNAGYSTAESMANRSQPVTTPQSDLLRSSIIAQTIPNYGTLTNISEPAADSQLPILSPPILLAEERNHAEETILQNQNVFVVGSMLTILALMLQFLFLGFALAVETSWYYLGFACSQNFILTFSACSEVSMHNKELTYVAMSIALLSAVSPIGLIVAMINTDFVETLPSSAKGIVAAVACGVLMYTTFYEVLKKRDQNNVTGLVKFAAIILGASVMAGLQYVAMTL